MARGPGLWPLAVGLWRLPCGDLAYGYLAVWPKAYGNRPWPGASWAVGFRRLVCGDLAYGYLPYGFLVVWPWRMMAQASGGLA